MKVLMGARFLRQTSRLPLAKIHTGTTIDALVFKTCLACFCVVLRSFPPTREGDQKTNVGWWIKDVEKTLYLCNRFGIFKTTDGGQSYKLMQPTGNIR